MQAVACVVLNRVNTAREFGGYWWGNTIIKSVTRLISFPAGTKPIPNYRKLIVVTDENIHFRHRQADRTAGRARLYR